MNVQIDVDGMETPDGSVCIGKATRLPDGSWRSLASVGGALCVVELKLTGVDLEEIAA